MGEVSEEQILKLANSLRESRLVASMEEALRKAEDILSGALPTEQSTMKKMDFLEGITVDRASTEEGDTVSASYLAEAAEEEYDEEIDLDIDPEDEMPEGIIDPSQMFTNQKETR